MRPRRFGRWWAVVRRSPLLAGAALKAWATLEPDDWSRLATGLGEVVPLFPDSLRLLRLHGRVSRAARRFEGAITANERALRLAPDDAGILLELGRAMRHAGRRAEAIDALSASARLGSVAAARDLRRYAARAALPAGDDAVFTQAHYDAFARSNPVPVPPSIAAAVRFRLTLATPSEPDSRTLRSLREQSYPHWTIAGENGSESDVPLDVFEMVLPSGAILDRHCLAWLNWAVARTGCTCVRADHDHLDASGEKRCDPVLLPRPDFLWTENPDRIVTLEARRRDEPAPKIAHVPLVLVTLPHPAAAPAPPSPDSAPMPISVIIPSRDNPDLLATAVTTLLEQASAPDMVEIIIIDNLSSTPEAATMFRRLGERENTRILPFPEPFNWSRANNFGASIASGEVLLFLNDDTAMVTPGWDRILAGILGDRRVGLAGARMIYPDDTIQHGGFVFGMDNGPQHEGRWMAATDGGPAGRWNAVRQTVAVTGAFMAIRASTFANLGGFDEAAFAIDFADVDLCLRVRSLGLAVAYCGAITLRHHESVSRGLNLSRSKRRRMRKERACFDARWVGEAACDPGYHPAWVREGASYDGLRALDIAAVTEYASRATAITVWAIPLAEARD